MKIGFSSYKGTSSRSKQRIWAEVRYNQQDLPGAIADLTQAIKINSNWTEFYQKVEEIIRNLQQ